jgi:hypothetical protein
VEIRAESQQHTDVGRLVFDRSDVQRRLAKRVERLDRLAKLERVAQRVGVVRVGELVQRAGFDFWGRSRLGLWVVGRLGFARPAAGLAKCKAKRRQQKRPTYHSPGLGLVHPDRSGRGGFNPRKALEATKNGQCQKLNDMLSLITFFFEFMIILFSLFPERIL